MTILLFVGVVVAAGIGVLLWAFWSVLQFVALGVIAAGGIAFTVSEVFRDRKDTQKRKSTDSKSAADQSPN